MTKKIISILALAFAITTPALNIKTHAAVIPGSFPQNYKIVTATNGLNVRDKNCNRIDTIGYGTSGYTGYSLDNPNPSINCTVNGKSIKMVFFGYGTPSSSGYVAESFLSNVKAQEFVSTDKTTFKVNATSGLNLRYGNCKRVSTVKFGTIVQGNVPTDNPPVCKAKGVYYSMMPIYHNGELYFVASIYIDQIS
jgi:hypothetical protein